MPFESGNVTFQPCRLLRKLPEDVLEKFISKKAKSTNSLKDEPEIGWVTSRHLLDTIINEDTAYLGGYLSLVLRTAVRKIPASLLTAECKIDELAMMQANELHELTRKMKKEIKEDVIDRLLGQMPPSLSGTQFIMLQDEATMYLGTTSTTQVDGFIDQFRQTTDSEPYALTPDMICEDDHDVNANDLPRLNFSQTLRDELACNGTIGQDFLTWLLYLAESEGGLIKVADGDEFAFAIDGPLMLIADGNGALESIIRKGLPTLSSELQAALNVGKKLKQAKLIFGKGDDIWEFTFESENFAYKSMRLPQGEKLDKESAFQERMINMGIIDDAMKYLFAQYIDQVKDAEKYKVLQDKIKTWLNDRVKLISDT